MRRAVVGLVLLASLPLAGASQQGVSPLQSSSAGSIALIRDPHSTRADLAIPLCLTKLDDSLETNGIASGHEKGVMLPKATFTPEAKFTDEARKAAKENHGMTADVVINLVVDERGNTSHFCIIKSAGYGLDASATKAASQYRFEPARIGDKAVPYRLTILVQFRIR